MLSLMSACASNPVVVSDFCEIYDYVRLSDAEIKALSRKPKEAIASNNYSHDKLCKR